MRASLIGVVAVCCLLLLGCGHVSSRLEPLRHVRTVYSTDGAGGSIPELAAQPQVKALVREPGIVRVLVAHLDSTETTAAEFEGKPVPLGFVSLDVLLAHLPQAQYEIVSTGFADDGLWETVRRRYYFPPDVLHQPGGRARMEAVKQAWQELLEGGDWEPFWLPGY